MKKVININFQGRVIPIEETAYEILKQYIESLRQFFSNEEGRDEIINDIESRVGELFSEVLKKGASCITEEDVETIKHSIGRPEDFAAEDADYQNQSQTQSGTKEEQHFSANANYQTQGNVRPERFFRDENQKLLGGVCAGLANYFGIDKLVVRILFVIFTFGFGFSILVYLILWVAIPSSASTQIGSFRKRLFRDPDNKLISGVCGGLAAYFGVNVWIPRVLFLIPFLSFVTNWNHWGVFNFPSFLNLSFSPGATILYIVLWLIIPEASSTSDKLEMKGEKVDLNSIKNTIQKDMEGFGERAKEFGKEVGDRASKLGSEIGSRGKQFSSEATLVAKKSGSSIGGIIAVLFKIFAYFILGVILLSIVGSLFFIGVGATGLLRYKPYIIADGMQSLLLWGTYIFFIWIPVIGIITWIVRKITKSKANSNAIRFSFAAMWILGWICAIGLIASVANDFSYHNYPKENPVTLSDPHVQKLEVKYLNSDRYYFNNSFFHFEPFASIDEDTVFFNNIHLRILKSDNDSFNVRLLRFANGSSKEAAEKRAQEISYNIYQKDSVLTLDRGIPVTKNEKFRNQSVYITVYVPVGKKIYVDDEVERSNDFYMNFGNDVDNWNWRSNREGYDWSSNTEYIMTNDGLKETHPKVDEDNNNDENSNDERNQKQGSDSTQVDSSRYHYQQTSEVDKPAAWRKSVIAPATQIKSAVKITDLASAFLERFSL